MVPFCHQTELICLFCVL